MAQQTILQQTQQLLPEYQERFLKDLLANIYQTDPTTGKVSGIAAYSPLFGKAVLDAAGNPVYQRDAAGNIRYDAFGQPMPVVEGGVPTPEVMPFTPAQQRAVQRQIEQGIGIYEPYFEEARAAMRGGIGELAAAPGLTTEGAAALRGTTGAYRPEMARPYYNQYVEDVIDVTQRDIARQGDIERGRIGAEAVQAGAFGGSRQAVAEQELARNVMEQQARTGAQLRSAAYEQAQKQAQGVFENQMARGQTASQIFGQLGQGLGSLGVQRTQAGTAMGGLGEAAQTAFGRDVDRLFNIGAAEQAQRQAEYDVQRAGAIEEAYEPFQRFAYMSDILRGVPSTSGTLTARSAPTPSPVSTFLGYYNMFRNMPSGTGALTGQV